MKAMRPGDLVIEDRWLTFLEAAPVMCLLAGASCWWAALGMLFISYGMHFASREARYLMSAPGMKRHLFVFCPIIYLLAVAALWLPVIPLPAGQFQKLDFPRIGMAALAMLLVAGKLFVLSLRKPDEAKDGRG